MRLPRNTSLAPPKRSLMKNRPMEGTNVKTQPASTPGAVSGSVTVKKGAQRRSTHIAAGFHQRPVHLLHGGIGRQDHEGQKRVDHAQHHRAEGVEQLERLVDQPQRLQKDVDRPIAHQKDAPAVDAHQRVRPEGHDHQQHQHRAPLGRRLGHQVAEGIAHQKADHRGDRRQLEAVSQHLEVTGLSSFR